MIEFAEPRIIRPATETDIEALQKSLPKDDATLHASRYAAQKSGDAAYLIAVQNTVPVGHVFVLFTGSPREAVKSHFPDPVPDVTDLFVDEKHRNRKVASRLLTMAEALAAARGFAQIGAECETGNADAKALYAQRGYHDSGIAPLTSSATNTDGESKDVAPGESLYLLKPLAATENPMENNTTPESDAATETGASPAEPFAPAQETTPTGRPVGEQVVDFAFGVALTAVEVLEKAVRTAQAEAPGVFQALQEKGRPAREKLVQSLREETREEAEAVDKGTDETPIDPETPGDSDSGGVLTATPPVEPAPIKPAPRPFGWGRSGNASAEDEIRALEDRVKSLEREVVVAPPAPTIAQDAVDVSAQTPAESGTSLVDFSPESADGDALANSAYAITDDEERAAAPSQTGTFVATVPESSPESVSAYVDGVEAPATDANIGDGADGQAAPAKAKRAKKTTTDASAGENDTPEVGEEPES